MQVVKTIKVCKCCGKKLDDGSGWVCPACGARYCWICMSSHTDCPKRVELLGSKK